MKRLLFATAVALLATSSAFADTYETGTIPVTLGPCVTPVTKDATYYKNDTTGETRLVLPNFNCTSSAAGMDITGLPPELTPIAQARFAVYLYFGGNIVPGQAAMVTGVGQVSFTAFNGTTLVSIPATGFKGLANPGYTLTYQSVTIP